MGLLDNLMNKIGEKLEQGLAHNMTGESKELYEKEKAEKAIMQAELAKKKEVAQAELDTHKVKIDKNELKNLEVLLQKINVIDTNKLWLAGFDNFKANQNTKAANLFSGKKNIKILSYDGTKYYLSKFDGDNFFAYKQFIKADVTKLEIEGLINKKIKLNFKDGKSYSVDIIENKEKASNFKNMLK